MCVRVCNICRIFWLRKLYEADSLKPGSCGSRRVWANACGVFRCLPSRGGPGCRAAVDIVVCFGWGGFFRVFFPFFFSSNALGLLQVWGRLASFTYLLVLDVNIPSWSRDLQYTRFVFSWSHLDELKNSGSFCVGQVPGTSDFATRPKKHTCERRVCPLLPWPFAAGLASSLFVVIQNVLDVIRIPGTTVVASPVFCPPFLFCFLWACGAGSFKKKTRYSGK